MQNLVATQNDPAIELGKESDKEEGAVKNGKSRNVHFDCH